MKPAIQTVLAVCIATLQACSIMIPVPVSQGDTEAEVVAKRGQPAHRYRQGSETLLEYPTGPFGQRTYMARLGPDGRVISFDQVLNTHTFAKLKVGEATKADVLRTIGSPSETSYLSLTDLEVWSYPYKESDVWNSMMHVHFDKSGIVRKMLNGPDPRYDPDRRFPFGFLR